MAGTIHVPQLQGMPAHANLPIFAPQDLDGQVRRPESGGLASGSKGTLEDVGSDDDGKSDGRIQVSGWRKMWAHVDGGNDVGVNDDMGTRGCVWDETLLFPGVC